MNRERQRSTLPFWLRALAVAALLAGPTAAPAAVEIVFKSRAFGETFPHAFVVLSGTIDATGERVETNYGFTVRHQIGPSVLFGPVQGHVIREPRDYAASGRPHFSLTLSDEEYGRVIALVARWRALPQPSYELNRRNCVTFVAEIATTLGLDAVPDRATRTRPQAFLERVRQANAAVIEARTPMLAARPR